MPWYICWGLENSLGVCILSFYHVSPGVKLKLSGLGITVSSEPPRSSLAKL